jgi:hypothetical protein
MRIPCDICFLTAPLKSSARGLPSITRSSRSATVRASATPAIPNSAALGISSAARICASALLPPLCIGILKMGKGCEREIGNAVSPPCCICAQRRREWSGV